MNRPSQERPARLLLVTPILKKMNRIEGWLEEDEADLLIASAAFALERHPETPALLEIGSYCGRSTVALASVVEAIRPEARVYAVDPHDGNVGAADSGVHSGPGTFDRFQRNLSDAGVAEYVVPIRSYSFEVSWSRPVAMLLIDGLHDYHNVRRDFQHFAPCIAPGGLVAFHDYADYYPGVKRFVSEILAGSGWREVRLVRSLMVIERVCDTRGFQLADDTRE